MNIQFIGFTPDRHDKFVSLVMLMVGSIVEATYVRVVKNTIVTEPILIVGATQDDGLYFSRNLQMANHAWILKKSAESKKFAEFYCLEWDRIRSLVYIGNYEEANSYLADKAYE